MRLSVDAAILVTVKASIPFVATLRQLLHLALCVFSDNLQNQFTHEIVVCFITNCKYSRTGIFFSAEDFKLKNNTSRIERVFDDSIEDISKGPCVEVT